MPWMIPSGPEEYLQLIKDVDREAFAVHMDFANMINGMDRYHNREAFLDRCFALLGPYIKSVHLKDVILKPGLPCLIGGSAAWPGCDRYQRACFGASRVWAETCLYS